MINKNTFPLFRMSLLSAAIATVASHSTVVFAADAADSSEEIIVTGYKGSLQSATNAKRESTALVESVFAEDIGKFSDSNIAEAINRMPGVQINRDPFGEGVNISVRGLGSSFTKVLLNGAQIAVATSGTIDTQNQNREVDLNLFPTELFTRFDIQKTPTASVLEGGVSGIVNIRAARPFDSKEDGFHTNVNAQEVFTQTHSTTSPKLAVSTSWRNDTFGVLAGVSYYGKKLVTEGYETIGWSNFDVTNRMCDPATALQKDSSSSTCSPSSSNNIGIPGIDRTAANTATYGYGKVPVNAGAGTNSGDIIDQAYLLAKNPGLNITQISEALLPRLGRPVYMDGAKNRTTGLLSFEYRPSDSMQFYLDIMSNNQKTTVDRIDMNLIGRNGQMIPLNMKVDAKGVVSSVTLANAQFFLEARPYKESAQFYNINPGAHFEFSELSTLDLQANHGRSEWFREAPSVLVNTPLNQGIYVNYTNGEVPTFDVRNAAGKVDLNNPNLGWVWAGGRLNIQNERRNTDTDGLHMDYRFGDNANNIKFGLAYDVTGRWIRGYDNSGRWEDVACRNGLDAAGNSPNPRAACNGLNPNSAVPQSALASYLRPSDAGFISVNFDKFLAATNYYSLRDSAPEGGGSATGASTARLDEMTRGGYLEFNTTTEVAGHELKLNLGSRYVYTNQNVAGPVSIPAIGSAPAFRLYVENPVDYSALLPSFNATFKAADDIILRFATSRTLTRPNPSAMLPSTNFSDPSAQTATYGNPALSPYLSNNIDFGGEWYTGDEGYVGVTLFGKNMTGFTTAKFFPVPLTQLVVAQGYPAVIPASSYSSPQVTAVGNKGGAQNVTVTVSQQQNSGELFIEGAEITWVQPLDIITKGLGINANYTHIHQRPQGAGGPQAYGVSPVTYNFTTYWENYGISLRATYVWNDKTVNTDPGQNGVVGARLYSDARGQLDLSASYTFADMYSRPSVSLSVTNITDTPLRMTFAQDSATYSSFKTGYIATLGVSAHF